MRTAIASTRCVATISGKRPASDRTVLLELTLPEDTGLGHRPGQFIGLEAPDGRARYFSIANAVPVGGHIELHINRVPGGLFTGGVLDALKVGDTLSVSGPFGDFCLPPATEHPLILVAGGTGFAPIKACLQQLARDPLHHRRALRLYWGVRGPADLYDMASVQNLCARLPNLVFTPVVDQWEEGLPCRRGPLHKAILADFESLVGHDICACGAPPMIEALTQACAHERGFDPARLVADFFVVDEPTSDPKVSDGATLNLTLVTPDSDVPLSAHSGESLLHALKRLGSSIQSVCGGKAACGTCGVHVLEPWRAQLPSPSKKEARLLSFIGAQAGDRLACQISLDAQLDGLKFSIPVDNQGARQ